MLGSAVLMVQWELNKGVPVKQEYYNYLNAAPEMYDPVLIIQTLERALQGIENLGLDPPDNGAAFSWDVNYHHTVQFNIDQINSAIDLGNNIIQWKEMSYQGTVVENVNDVYYEKVLNLRRKVDEVDSINISYAYCFNNKPGLFWFVYDWYIMGLGLVQLCVGFLLLMFWDG